jgi:hypothetical protein
VLIQTAGVAREQSAERTAEGTGIGDEMAEGERGQEGRPGSRVEICWTGGVVTYGE